MISMFMPRFRRTRALLRSIGFGDVHRVQPVALDDPRVLREEAEHRWKSDAAHGSPRAVISLALTHRDLWSAFPAAAHAEWMYVFEDDVKLRLEATLREVPCLLSRLEALASALPKVPLLYLGFSDANYPADVRTSAVWVARKQPRPPAVGAHSASPCAALCKYAYAVRRSAAPTLWARARRVVLDTTCGIGMWARLRLRYNVDTNLRAYFTKAGTQDGPGALPAAEWPLCIDLGSQGVLSMDHSAGSSQNHSRAAGW